MRKQLKILGVCVCVCVCQSERDRERAVEKNPESRKEIKTPFLYKGS